MKHLLTGVAVVAALAISAPVSAQQANPSGGNSMGMPGPSPGGPGLTPYTTAPTPTGRMPAGGRRTSGERIPPIMPETSAASDTTSATPPTHHHAHAAHKVASHHPSRFPKVTGDNSANQLNQAEVARLEQGAPPMAPQMAPPPPSFGGGNAVGTPGPNPGGPGLTPYSGGAPQR